MKLPTIVVPRVAVNELLRIGKEPTGVMTDGKTVTFILDDETWLHTTLVDAKWPLVDKFFVGIVGLPPIPAKLVEAVETVYPFCTNPKLPKIYFTEDGVNTGEGILGAEVEMEGLSKGSFHGDVLRKLLPSIETIDFISYPKSCSFTGAGGLMSGVLMGLVT